jgi:Restriction endonuclease
MIVTTDDIDEFEVAWRRVTRRKRLEPNIYGAIFDGHEGELELNEWLANNPQVLMAGANLQEFVAAHELPMYRELVKKRIIIGFQRPAFRDFHGQWVLTTSPARGRVAGYSIEGIRYALTLDEDSDEFEDTIDGCLFEVARINDVLEQASRLVDRDYLNPTVYVSPKLWTPTSQSKEKDLIRNAATPLLAALQSEARELGSLHWRELEDIVAEVLRATGLQIHKARESPQGGRDIVARIQIAPNEILTVAVEIKHQNVVGLPQLHKALHQNAHFPALMLITSGRFSAGVIQEARKSENRLRLFLKDGVAIRDLIRTYPLQR